MFSSTIIASSLMVAAAIAAPASGSAPSYPTATGNAPVAYSTAAALAPYSNSSSSIVAPVAAVSGTAPLSTGTSCAAPATSTCVTQKDAKDMADIFQSLIQNYSDAVALEGLTEDFTDWTSSVLEIINMGAEAPMNLSGPSFVGRQAFMDGQGAQPQIPFEQLNLFYGCDSVSLRWKSVRSAAGQATEVAAEPVIGNAIMVVVPAEAGNKYNFRIQTLYSEFNSGAWLVNLGIFTPTGPVTRVTQNDTSIVSKRSLSTNLRGNMI